MSLTGFGATLKEIAAVPTPDPTDTYVSVPFIELIDSIKERLAAHGFKIDSEHYSLVKPKKEPHPLQIFGTMTLEDNKSHPDFRQAIGFRSSHNKTLPIGVCGGGFVLVCTNLEFIGDYKSIKKHTTKVRENLPVMLDDILEQMGEVFNRHSAFVDALKNKTITTAEAHDLMMQAVRFGAFPVSKLLRVIEAWEIERKTAIANAFYSHPRFGYTDKGDTAWDLFNAFTFVNKERTAANQIDDSMGLTAVFESSLGLN